MINIHGTVQFLKQTPFSCKCTDVCPDSITQYIIIIIIIEGLEAIDDKENKNITPVKVECCSKLVCDHLVIPVEPYKYKVVCFSKET